MQAPSPVGAVQQTPAIQPLEFLKSKPRPQLPSHCKMALIQSAGAAALAAIITLFATRSHQQQDRTLQEQLKEAEVGELAEHELAGWEVPMLAHRQRQLAHKEEGCKELHLLSSPFHLLRHKVLSLAHTHTHPQAALEHEREKRAADRKGRIKAEQQLRSVQQQQAAAALAAATAGLGSGSGGSKGATAGTNGSSSTVGGTDANGKTSESGAANLTTAVAHQWAVYPMRPIGHLHSCFSQRNGE